VPELEWTKMAVSKQLWQPFDSVEKGSVGMRFFAISTVNSFFPLIDHVHEGLNPVSRVRWIKGSETATDKQPSNYHRAVCGAIGRIGNER
jgi:hypothetical protein